MYLLLSIFTLTLLTSRCAARAIAPLPVVDLGYAVNSATLNQTGGYFNFSNIRYGEPPVEALRFAAPLPPQSTNRTVNDGQVARICPQAHPAWQNESAQYISGVPPDQIVPAVFNLSTIPQSSPEESEDCLFLDVMVPTTVYNSQVARSQREGSNSTTKGASVLVWIDGGGFANGYKHEHNPAGLLARSLAQGGEGVVFVAMNYRVGLFGFLAGPTLQANGSANAGLLDQQLALEWVQKNIALFGGDPDRVTIIGESAGGGSVLHQITAYGGLRKPLFQQAILQSAGFQPNPEKSYQERIFQYVLGNATEIASTNVNSLEKLRDLPLQKLKLVNDAIVGRSPYGLYTFGPVVDGSFVPDLPGTLIAQKRFDTGLSGLLMGTNYHEGTLFSSPYPKSNQGYEDALAKFIPTASQSTLTYIADKLYPDELSGKYNYTIESQRLATTVSEGFFSCNTRYLNLALPQLASTSIFEYSFDVEPALHAEDTEYTFWNGEGTVSWDGRPVNSTVARVLQDYIVNFVRFGSPNVGLSNLTTTGLPWFPAYSHNASVLSLNTTGDGTLRVDRFANPRCDWWQTGQYYR